MYMLIQLYTYVCIFFWCKDVVVISNKIKKGTVQKKMKQNHSKCQTSNAFKWADKIAESEKAEPARNSHIVFCLKIKKKILGHKESPNKIIESRSCKCSFYDFPLDKIWIENLVLKINYLSWLLISTNVIRTRKFFMSVN